MSYRRSVNPCLCSALRVDRFGCNDKATHSKDLFSLSICLACTVSILKKKICPQWNRMFGNTSIIFFDLSLSHFVHMPTRIVSSQKGLRNGIVFTKTKMRVKENIVFVTKLFLKYQLAVDMWPTWRGRRHCYDHWLIRAAFLEWGVFSCVCEWVLQTVLWKNIQPQ